MRLHLFIDADDTLWENNVYFESVFEEFVELLGHSRLTPAQVRARLDEIEHVNNRIHGYGAANFARNLRQCYLALSERGPRPRDLESIDEYGRRLAAHPIELLDGVGETLAELAGRHELTVFTKGNPEEQRAKIERSGLAGFFHFTAIVREKDAAAYRVLLADRGLEATRCWMVGNSPKSDINPALEAGLGAVYIPHPRTWHLEHQEVRDGAGRLLVLERFSDLRKHF